MPYNPQIDSIYKRGSNGAGVLLLHGFTGTADSMRPLANRLFNEGYTVLAPLLAGHGTTAKQCAETGWREWLQSAQKSYMELHEKCSKIFVCGLSLGGLLSLKMCLAAPQSLSAICTLSTPLYLNAWVRAVLPIIWHSPLRKVWRFQKKWGVDIKNTSAKQNFWNYNLMPIACIASIMELQRTIAQNLGAIQTPLLLIHSRHDNTAPYDSMNRIARAVSSPITETVTLENSYHVVTIDNDREIVNEKVAEFFNRFL